MHVGEVDSRFLHQTFWGRKVFVVLKHEIRGVDDEGEIMTTLYRCFNDLNPDLVNAHRW